MADGKRKLPRIPSKRIQVQVVFVNLQKEANDERIKRLSHQILGVLADGRKRPEARDEFSNDLNAGLEETIGI
jgi:hypothetical protein